MNPEIKPNQRETEPRLKTEVVFGQQLYDTVQSLFFGQNPMLRALLFGGERLSVCDEGMVLKLKDQVVGLATIAPEGEAQSGTPTIVGLFVRPEYRQKGFGSLILEKAIERCLERGFEKVKVDVMSAYAMKIIEKLPPELKEKLVVYDMGDLMNFF